MAIDMIENNDLGALASGRLGDLTQFSDESKIFKNFTGNEEVFDKIDTNEEFENLFGSKAHKDSKAKTKVEAENFVRSLPKASCDNIRFSLEKLALYIEAETKGLAIAKGRMTEYPKIKLSVARGAEADLKMKQLEKNCLEIAAKAESEQNRAQLLDTLTNVSEASVQQAKTDLFGVPTGKPLYAPAPQGGGLGSALGSNKNLLIFGGIGVIALILILRNR
jgi:hypothetical protein